MANFNKLSRFSMLGISIGIGIVVIAILSFLLPGISKNLAIIVLDRYSTIFTYPFTIQNIMLVLFSIGLGELFLRWRDSSNEMAYTVKAYLPEDDRTVLQSHDLGPVRQKVIRDIKKEEGAFLPNLINRCILQFQTSKSVGETNSVMNSLVEVYFHQIELRYTILRYIAWAIPTIGFIGTVVGIASSLSGIKSDNPDLVELTATLGVAFNTTLLALFLSAILVFLIYIVQEKEERSLNKAMEYCLNNLINRLYTSD
jgi:biopolymer transport protein ExbB/TolQ